MIGKLLKKAFTPVYPNKAEPVQTKKNEHTITINSVRTSRTHMTLEEIEYEGYEVVGQENGVLLIRKRTK